MSRIFFFTYVQYSALHLAFLFVQTIHLSQLYSQIPACSMIRWTQTLLRSPRNGLRRPSFARHFASSSSSSPSAGAEKEPTSSPAQTPDLQQLEETLVYEGPLGGKLQRIRRISISSTILTVFGLVRSCKIRHWRYSSK